jgi:hypothetical protein
MDFIYKTALLLQAFLLKLGLYILYNRFWNKFRPEPTVYTLHTSDCLNKSNECTVAYHPMSLMYT